MGNPLRGEVDLAAGDKTYRLRFSVNAIAALEDELDKPITEIGVILSSKQGVRIGMLRQIFRAALADATPGLSLEDAGEIMQTAGMPESAEAIAKAFRLAFPAPKKSGRPQKEAGGTG